MDASSRWRSTSCAISEKCAASGGVAKQLHGSCRIRQAAHETARRHVKATTPSPDRSRCPHRQHTVDALTSQLWARAGARVKPVGLLLLRISPTGHWSTQAHAHRSNAQLVSWPTSRTVMVDAWREMTEAPVSLAPQSHPSETTGPSSPGRLSRQKSRSQALGTWFEARQPHRGARKRVAARYTRVIYRNQRVDVCNFGAKTCHKSFGNVYEAPHELGDAERQDGCCTVASALP